MTIHISSMVPEEASACRQYKYLLLLNSSARGPFLPAYAPPGFHWTHPFLNKITDKVKLVGSTINCGGAYGHPPVPHVQTYVVATDSKGLEILADAVSSVSQHALLLVCCVDVQAIRHSCSLPACLVF